MGQDGYPAPVWDKATGEIDAKVAKHWEKYDISAHVMQNWRKPLVELPGKTKTYGEILSGKVNVNVGAMDNFFLNDGVFLLENAVANLTSPLPRFTIRYGSHNGRGYMHAWSGNDTISLPMNALTLHQRMVALATDHMLATAPEGADVTTWRY